jgi:hypothetical protein
MKKEAIQLNDMERILFGTAPIEFTIEVLIRTLIVYRCLLIILKFLDMRMTEQITIQEMSVVVVLGVIVGVGVQVPTRKRVLSQLRSENIFHLG